MTRRATTGCVAPRREPAVAHHLVAVTLIATAACSIDDRSVIVAGASGDTADGGAGAGGESGGAGIGSGGEGAPVMLCTGVPLVTYVITDFSDAVENIDDEQKPGVGFDFQDLPQGGESFTYYLFGLDPPLLSLSNRGGNKELHVVANPLRPISSNISIVGLGLGWLRCYDATGYRGISFRLEGSLGTCTLSVGAQIAENTIVRLNSASACEREADCYAPQSPSLPSTEGTHEVAFADMANGSPMPDVDATRIVGVNFQLHVPVEGPPCEADFTLDDVAFYR